MLKLIFKAI